MKTKTTKRPKSTAAPAPRRRNALNLYTSALYRLLVDKLPSEYVKGDRLDTDKLSKATGFARYTVYQWMNRGTVSPKVAGVLLKLSTDTDEAEKKGSLTRDDLVPFLGF